VHKLIGLFGEEKKNPDKNNAFFAKLQKSQKRTRTKTIAGSAELPNQLHIGHLSVCQQNVCIYEEPVFLRKG
jgi:hypothetical protein